MTSHKEEYHARNRRRRQEKIRDISPNMIRPAFFSSLTPLKDTVAELIRRKGLTTAVPPEIGDIHDLPGEVLDEHRSPLQTQSTINLSPWSMPTATLDQILVGLYRKFKVAQKRRFLQNKLYRMPMVWSVPGRKGVYTTERKSRPTPIPLHRCASQRCGLTRMARSLPTCCRLSSGQLGAKTMGRGNSEGP